MVFVCLIDRCLHRTHHDSTAKDCSTVRQHVWGPGVHSFSDRQGPKSLETICPAWWNATGCPVHPAFFGRMGTGRLEQTGEQGVVD